MKKLYFNMNSYKEECNELGRVFNIETNDFEPIYLLRHEREEFYNVRLRCGINFFSVNAKHLEIKEE